MFDITSSIQIDAAHRVPDHQSKCFNLHGHRYVINATVQASELHKEGEQTGMVMDFSFLKRAMMGSIHDNCDHALLWYIQDPLVQAMYGLEKSAQLRELESHFESVHVLAGFIYRPTVAGTVTQTVCLNFVPTAENLAEWWFWNIFHEVRTASQGLGQLIELEVYETPNNKAVYRPSTKDIKRMKS